MKISLVLRNTLLVALASLTLFACGSDKNGNNNDNNNNYYNSRFTLTPFAQCPSSTSETFKDSILAKIAIEGFVADTTPIITSKFSANELFLTSYPLRFKLNSATAFTKSEDAYPFDEKRIAMQNALYQLQVEREKIQNAASDSQSKNDKQSTSNSNSSDTTTDSLNQSSDDMNYNNLANTDEHVITLNFETQGNDCIITILDYKNSDGFWPYHVYGGVVEMIKIGFDKSSIILE